MKTVDIAPGRDLDRLVAENIMGWTKKIWKDPYDGTVYSYLLRYPDQSPKEAVKEILPAYSRELSSATEVVERMQSLGFQLYIEQINHPKKNFVAAFYKVTLDNKALVYGKTTEHVICLAALDINYKTPIAKK